MNSFSIELSAERIDDLRSREYFREVLSSYINGNYRSAVVMLWSVVICDLVYKLQKLQEIYNDATSEAILTEIQAQQETNPKSPDWEVWLLKTVRDRTELIDNAEYDSLLHLQNRRHLSAHPILTNVDLLFSPDRDTVRALIRNALECVLLKPPILSRKITSDLVVDLAAKKDLFPDDQSLRRYLEHKYLRNLRPIVENRLFRDLWKFVFRLSNPDTDTNRDINYRALKIIYLKRPTDLRDYIKSEQDFFSEIGNNNEQLAYLVDFLSQNPTVYSLLTDVAIIPIRTFVQSDVDSFARAVFLSGDVETHLHELKKIIDSKQIFTSYQDKAISEDTWLNLLQLARETNVEALALDVAIEIHAKSGNFNFADNSFSVFIEPYLNLFNAIQLLRLIDGINSNDQAYNRRRAKTDYEKLYRCCLQVFDTNFDYQQYPNFYREIKDLIESSSDDNQIEESIPI